MKFKPSKFVADNYPTPQRYNTVIKSNQLIQQSRFSLSTQQQKIVLYIISQIEPYDEELKRYTFTVKDFCRVCGIEPKGDMYALIKKQIQEISNKSIWVKLENGKETIVRWIEKPYIDANSGKIEIKLDEDMKPYLIQLKEKFTEYELIYTLNFKSKYSIRLYEFLKSIHYKKLEEYTQTIPIDRFINMFECNYTAFKDFHTRVLKPACKEINTYSDILVDYELIKDGRKTKDIIIKIKSKPAMDRFETAYTNDKLLEKGYKNE